jgi:hypothetical protein
MSSAASGGHNWERRKDWNEEGTFDEHGYLTDGNVGN